MKKPNTDQAKSLEQNDDMLPEYNFTGEADVRDKYYRDYQQGHTVRVYQEDGSVTVQYFTLEEEKI